MKIITTLIENKLAVAVIGIVLAVSSIGIYSFTNFAKPNSSSISPMVSPTPSAVPVEVPKLTQPTGEKITIKGIQVQNFYPMSTDVNTTNDVLIFGNDEYVITYVASYQKFIISLTDKNFVRGRAQAERKFLELLKISRQDACKLEVEESVPVRIENNQAGGVYYLSFCEPLVH